jgi:hypothetical protein
LAKRFGGRGGASTYPGKADMDYFQDPKSGDQKSQNAGKAMPVFRKIEVILLQKLFQFQSVGGLHK